MPKLWHDDELDAPPGWLRARNNTEAIHLLLIAEREGTPIDECSLDHDIASTEETGYDLVKWMIDSDLVPRVVTIHSRNYWGAKSMADALIDATPPNLETLNVKPFRV